MFEIILLFVLGAFIYSIFQSISRGSVPPDEREKNPTLLENVSTLTERLLESSTIALEEDIRNADANREKRRQDTAKVFAERERAHKDALAKDPRVLAAYNRIMGITAPNDMPSGGLYSGKENLETSVNRGSVAASPERPLPFSNPERNITGITAPNDTPQSLDGHTALLPWQNDIRTQAQSLGIQHVVHFTRCDNLSSIMKYGLRSIACLENEKIHAVRNDMLRLDGKPNGISLSISFPNFRMFYKYRQLAAEADWAVLILSPRILWEKECGFYKHNAADSRMRNLPREVASSSKAFREMFETADVDRENWLSAYDPSDPQAEVMVYEKISPSLIEAVAFETRATAEKWANLLGGIETIHARAGKGLFGPRGKVRQYSYPAMNLEDRQILSQNKRPTADAAHPILRGEESITLRKDTIQSASSGPMVKTSVSDKDAPLMSALKAKRRALAEAARVPAYVIVPDRTLIEMADARPRDLDAMARINGIGAKKLEVYGAAFLAVVTGAEAEVLHPDCNSDNPKAEEQFKEMNEAYEVLKDADKKAAYDSWASAFSDVYEELFRDFYPPRSDGAVFDRLSQVHLDLQHGPKGIDKRLSCTQTTLRHIAEKRPASLADLDRIPGMGGPRTDRFGEAFLAVIAGD